MGQLLDTLKQNREEILRLAKKYRAENVRLFGSVARGIERADSDIDLLVDFQSGASLLDQVGLADELTRKLGKRVDVVSSRGLNRHLAQRILQEALKL